MGCGFPYCGGKASECSDCWRDSGPTAPKARRIAEPVARISPQYFTAFSRQGFQVSTHKIAPDLVPLYAPTMWEDIERMRAALNRIAEHTSSDWPERCQENVRIAREALKK